MYEQDYDNVSEDVQEILGKPPSWVMMWGTSVLIMVMALIGVVGWYFKYPDKVKGKITLTTPKPPIPITTPEGGRLARLLVEDQGHVKSNQPLALLENPAIFEDVERLEKEVSQLISNEESLLTYEPDETLNLGDIQSAYGDFIQTYKELSFTSNSTFDIVEVNELRKKIKNLEKEIRSIEEKKKTTLKKLDLAGDEFSRLQAEYAGTTIKDSTRQLYMLEKLQDGREKMYDLDQTLENHDGTIAKIEQDINDLRIRITGIRYGSKKDKNNQSLELDQSLLRLRSSIERWKKRYILNAPIAGQVMFYNFQNEHQYFQPGDEVMAVVPTQDSTSYLGQVYLPMQGSGKVDLGDKVVIKFDRYPYQEFGIVRGRIAKIPNLHKDATYYVEVSLPDGLVTNFGKSLEFRQQMTGKVEVIVEEKRFVARLFEEVWSIFV